MFYKLFRLNNFSHCPNYPCDCSLRNIPDNLKPRSKKEPKNIHFSYYLFPKKTDAIYDSVENVLSEVFLSKCKHIYMQCYLVYGYEVSCWGDGPPVHENSITSSVTKYEKNDSLNLDMTTDVTVFINKNLTLEAKKLQEIYVSNEDEIYDKLLDSCTVYIDIKLYNESYEQYSMVESPLKHFIRCSIMTANAVSEDVDNLPIAIKFDRIRKSNTQEHWIDGEINYYLSYRGRLNGFNYIDIRK